MKVYVLITSDKTVSGIYSSKNQLVCALTTSLASVSIDAVEVWDVDTGFVEYLKINKTTTVTIEN